MLVPNLAKAGQSHSGGRGGYEYVDFIFTMDRETKRRKVIIFQCNWV